MTNEMLMPLSSPLLAATSIIGPQKDTKSLSPSNDGQTTRQKCQNDIRSGLNSARFTETGSLIVPKLGKSMTANALHGQPEWASTSPSLEDFKNPSSQLLVTSTFS
jgi:hypothetical protein